MAFIVSGLISAPKSLPSQLNLVGSATLGCFIFGFSDGAFIAQHAAGLEEHFQSVEPKRMSSASRSAFDHVKTSEVI